MDIQKMYEDQKQSFELKNKENLERDLRLFVNGGFQGLIEIYHNYHSKQKIKYSDVVPFEHFINTNDVETFYLNEVFYEVDNKYSTNIGCQLKSLSDYYCNSEKNIENKKVELISIITKLEEAIHKSATSKYNENPKLYDILKRIENYYRIAYSSLHEDFYPFFNDRPLNKSYGKDFLYVFDKIRETIPLKIALRFFTGELKILRKGNINKFSYKDKLYKSGNSLAKILSVEMNEKVESIKSYLNETYNQNSNDKNIFYSERTMNDVNKYALLNGLTLINFSDIEK